MRIRIRRARRPAAALIRRRRMARPMRSLVVNKLAGRRVHYFKRTAYYSGFISGSTLVDTYGALQFALSQVPNNGEFTALFDQYKINGVRVRLSPRANSAEIGTNQGLIKMFTAIDYNDITAPTAINDLLQYENCKATSSNREHVRYLKPKVEKAVYQSALVTGYGAGTAWIDTANPSVPHYGLKFALQQLPAGNQSYDVQVTYYLAFKQVR